MQDDGPCIAYDAELHYLQMLLSRLEDTIMFAGGQDPARKNPLYQQKILSSAFLSTRHFHRKVTWTSGSHHVPLCSILKICLGGGIFQERTLESAIRLQVLGLLTPAGSGFCQ